MQGQWEAKSQRRLSKQQQDYETDETKTKTQKPYKMEHRPEDSTTLDS